MERHRHRRALARLTLACCCALASAATAGAQFDVEFPDIVTLQPFGSAGKRVIRCLIVEYDGRSISLRTPDAATLTYYPSRDVTQIKTAQTAPHVEALARLARGETAEIGELIDRALKEEPRQWMRRELLALRVENDLRHGRYVDAANHFQLISDTDERNRHFGLIPLVWSSRVVPESQIAPAYQLLSSSATVQRLCAASILLEHPSFGAQARAEMAKLRGDRDARIASLAEAQLWRGAILKRDFTDYDVSRWLKAVDNLPESLRGGPLFLLGQARLVKLQREEAALTLLRLPILHPHDRHLTALALYDAALALRQHGRVTEANALFRELLSTYSETPSGADARLLLEQETPDTPASSGAALQGRTP